MTFKPKSTTTTKEAFSPGFVVGKGCALLPIAPLDAFFKKRDGAQHKKDLQLEPREPFQ